MCQGIEDEKEGRAEAEARVQLGEPLGAEPGPEGRLGRTPGAGSRAGATSCPVHSRQGRRKQGRGSLLASVSKQCSWGADPPHPPPSRSFRESCSQPC